MKNSSLFQKSNNKEKHFLKRDTKRFAQIIPSLSLSLCSCAQNAPSLDEREKTSNVKREREGKERESFCVPFSFRRERKRERISILKSRDFLPFVLTLAFNTRVYHISKSSDPRLPRKRVCVPLASERERMSPSNKKRDMWRNEDQDYIFPRINNLLSRTQLLNSEKKFKKIDKSNEEDRASSWKAWFAFMSSKHYPPDTSDGFSPEEVKRNAIFLAELMEKERRKVVEKSGKAPVGRPKMKKTLGDHVVGDKMRTNNNNNEEMKTPKRVVAGDAKHKRALETTTTTTTTTTEPFRTSPSLAINMDQAKAIQHCDDGKKKITIRFTPDSELISNTIKSTRQNPIVDLTFRLRKKLGDICDHFSEKWKEAAALLEREAREEEKRKTGNENGLRNKAFMFTMRPNMRGDNSVNLEPCVVWDKQIIGDMTAVKAYEMRGYPETFEIKYSWRFAPLPPPDGSGDKKRKDYTYRTKMAIKEQMIANRDSANNNNNKFDFSTVFDERTRTPLPPPEFTMSAFDVGAFVNGNEQEQPLETIKPSSQEKKRKIDTSSKFAKKPVPKEIKPETDSMLALKLQAELNGGNRERRNRKPMLEAEEEPEEEEEEEEYGGESDLENNDDNDMPISMWMKPDGEKENTSTGDFPNSLLPQGLAGFDSIFAGIGKEDDASRPCGESTMNGFAQVIFGGGGESKDAAMVAACLPKRNVETGPSSFAGLLS